MTILGGRAWSGQRYQDDRFPDPFCDMSSMVMPDTIRDALRWCEYILMANGPYRSAISRVISYFITDIEIVAAGGGDGENRLGKEEKQKYLDFLNDTLGIKNILHTVALDYLCFHGDTKAITRNGVFRLRDLAGQTVDVLSQNGVYRPAEFKSFGRQRLLEVLFSDGRKVLATPSHEWVVQKSNGGTVRVPTTKLAGRRIERTVAPRPPKNDDFYEGVRHGFTFGDGTLYNEGRQARANFYGAKDLAMLRYFEGHGSPPNNAREGLTHVHGLPPYFKELPDNTASASYWYGFVCGFMAADGSVDTYGCSVLTQASESTLNIIAEQLPRIGMIGGPVRGHWREADLSKYNGKEDAQYEGMMYYLTLLKQFMCISDILLDEHRIKFEENQTDTNYGKFIGVESVTETGIVDEVFCCVEHDTHTFVLENGVLTGNCYGNSFTSLAVPFRRYLSCPGCGLELPLKRVVNTGDFGFSWSGFKFNATCVHCQYSGAWKHIDRRSGEDGQIKVKRWSPHEMDILHDPYTDDTAFIWKIPDDYRNLVRQGHLFHLERASWEIIEAVRNNQSLMFDPDIIYHMKEDALSGLRNRGWGISRILANFRQAWYVQVLHRYNEAIALDYVIPFRVITPMPRPGQGGEVNDPVLTMNMGGFTAHVNRMIKRRRRDPAGWNVLPFPLEYKALGGDATQLAPKDLLELGMDTLLTSIGVPVDLYKGTLTVQAAPAAMRLFEANWSHLVHNLNRFLMRLVDKIAQVMLWEPVNCRLQRVSHADDMNRQMAQLQLMMGGQLSRTSGLEAVGKDFIEETRRKLEEERIEAELTAQMQREMDQSAQMDQMVAPGGDPAAAGGAPAAAGGGPAGGAPAGGAAPMGPMGSVPLGSMGQPAGAGGAAQAFAAGQPLMPNKPTTPEEMQQTADMLAQQILAMPESQKDSTLIQLKKEDPTMHSLVKSQIEDYRRQAQTQGGAQVMAQQFGKQGSIAQELYDSRRSLRSIILD